MLIIPALDIYQGKCVRLRRGQFRDRTVYSESPADVAQSILDAGFHYLHIVDLDGAKQGQVTNWKPLEQILALPGLKAEVGGGVRSKDDMQKLLQMGADRVIVGSIAVMFPSMVKKWIQDVGPRRIAIALDIQKGKIAHSGWQEQANYSPNTFLLNMVNAGATTFICTDIDQDGMLEGPNIDLYKEIRQFFNSVELIASGGVSSQQDIEMLATTGVSGVVVGKALYEGKIDLPALQRFIAPH